MWKLLPILASLVSVALGCVYYEPVPEYAAKPAGRPSPLSLDDVLRLSKAGVGDDVIIAKIKAGGVKASASADEIARMKAEGVSDPVLQAFVSAPVQAAPPPVIYRYYRYGPTSGWYYDWPYGHHHPWDHHGWYHHGYWH